MKEKSALAVVENSDTKITDKTVPIQEGDISQLTYKDDNQLQSKGAD